MSIERAQKNLKSTWYEFCKCEHNKEVKKMNQADQGSQEEEHKSTVRSGVSQKARGKNVSITLSEEFCKNAQTYVEIYSSGCSVPNQDYALAKIPRRTRGLNLGAFDAGIELVLEAHNKDPYNAAYVCDNTQDLGKASMSSYLTLCL